MLLSPLSCAGGCGSFFRVFVVSDVFAGQSLVQRHRTVNDRLRAELPLIHGMQMQCKTGAEFEVMQKEFAQAQAAAKAAEQQPK
jgi:stress-induced morphogen